MRHLTSHEAASVSAAGYWLEECGLFTCTTTYVYEEYYVPGYWLPEETITSCDPVTGACTSTYYPMEWVPGYTYWA